MNWSRRKAFYLVFVLLWIVAASIWNLRNSHEVSDTSHALPQSQPYFDLPKVVIPNQGSAAPLNAGFFIMTATNEAEAAIAKENGTVSYTIVYGFDGYDSSDAKSTAERYQVQRPDRLIEGTDARYAALLADLTLICDGAAREVIVGLRHQVDTLVRSTSKSPSPVIVLETDRPLVTVTLVARKVIETRSDTNYIDTDQFGANFALDEGKCNPIDILSEP